MSATADPFSFTWGELLERSEKSFRPLASHCAECGALGCTREPGAKHFAPAGWARCGADIISGQFVTHFLLCPECAKARGGSPP